MIVDNFSINKLAFLLEEMNDVFGLAAKLGWLIGFFALLAGGFGIAKFGRVYRAQNLAKVEVGDADYDIIRNRLGINVQLNLTTKGDTGSPSRTDIFDRCYNYNIPDYSDLFTQSKANF